MTCGVKSARRTDQYAEFALDGPVCVGGSPSWEAMAAAATGGDTAVLLCSLFVCGTCFSAGVSATQPAAAAAAARDVNSARCAAVIRAAGYMTPSPPGAGGGWGAALGLAVVRME